MYKPEIKDSVFLQMLTGEIKKPSLEQIFTIYSAELKPIIDKMRKLGAAPGQELDYLFKLVRDIESPLVSEPRNYPDFWRVGDIVKYTTTDEYGYKVSGQIAKIVELSEECLTTPASKYQVFWTTPISDSSFKVVLWTTPADVSFVGRSE